MKKILVAPDSFKGSLSAEQVCLITKEAINSLDDKALVDLCPMADGGEGTVEAVVFNKKGRMVTCQVEGPLGELTLASYGLANDDKTAIMEMAQASGITLVEADKRDPLKTSTIGVGQMIKDALDRGCREILLGIGGSASNDGGSGMLSALGFKFLDKKGNSLIGNGDNLGKIHTIDISAADPRLKDIKIYVACDVDNPLVGQRGATYVYGPQKGASGLTLEYLEKGMMNYAAKVLATTGMDVANLKGAGAAGGLGAGLVAFLGAKLESGFKMVSQAVGLESLIQEGSYDLIITGEGQINDQTLHGKLPYGVAQLGKKYKVPVVGIVGSIGSGYEPILGEGMVGVFSILKSPMSLEAAMVASDHLLKDTVKRVYNFFSSI